MKAPLLDRHVVAARLGIKPRTVTDLVARGDIEYLRVGKKLLRFTDEAIDAYLERQRRPATSAPTVEVPAQHEAALTELPAIRKRRLM